ncbi:SPX domain-containing protein [Russula dissimulans]|nr:SPX domain-containing protein [Russula dissimulans]
MKFARYLDNAQAPEWKRAYIDYRGLKKRITAIRRAQGSTVKFLDMSSPESDPDSFPSVSWASPHPVDGQENAEEGHEADDESNTRRGKHEQRTVAHSPDDQIEPKDLKKRSDDHIDPGKRFVSSPTPEAQQSALPPRNPRPQDGLRRRTTARIIESATGISSTPTYPLTLPQVLERMSPVQLAFFNKLNAELAKVESFFIEREDEARIRSSQLQEQLDELKDHRRLFHDIYPDVQHPMPLHLLPFPGSNAPKRISRVLHLTHAPTHTDDKVPGEGHDGNMAAESHEHRLAGGAKLVPDEYLHARKQLKRAVSEHYHALEVLNNYRILNITGFRKALKKFEKATGILVQDLYMKEKVDPCAFASDETVQRLLKEMEDFFTARFAKGDRKRALVRLRRISSHKTHHFSTFRTGLTLGLALPAIIDGLASALQPQTRVAIPSWGSLLYIYAILLVPTLLAFLVGTNLLIWNASRINYVFIFGTAPRSFDCYVLLDSPYMELADLDIRTRLDHREYFEVQAYL